MSVPNFSSVAGLEVDEKFVVVGWWVVGGEHLTTMSNSNASCFRVGLSWVALGFDNKYWLERKYEKSEKMLSSQIEMLQYVNNIKIMD